MRRIPALTILLVLVASSGCDSEVSADQGRNHQVQSGESLFSIAAASYGNGLEWPRIWEANPWVDPDRLRAGEVIYIPSRDDEWNAAPQVSDFAAAGGPSGPSMAADPGRRSSRNPGNASSGPAGTMVLHNLKRNVSERTLFGFTLEKVLFSMLLVMLIHTLLQSILVWITANITFVKEVTFKKSMKAIFLTEMLTFTTLVVLIAVGVLIVYVGQGPPAGGGAALFPSLEGFLRSSTGTIVAGLVLIVLYVTLSLRFLPQVFGVPFSHAVTLMAIAILIPHLAGFYLIGQRTGLIH